MSYHTPIVECVYCARRKSLQPVLGCDGCRNMESRRSGKIICSYKSSKKVSVKKVWEQAAVVKTPPVKYIEMSELIDKP